MKPKMKIALLMIVAVMAMNAAGAPLSSPALRPAGAEEIQETEIPLENKPEEIPESPVTEIPEVTLCPKITQTPESQETISETTPIPETLLDDSGNIEEAEIAEGDAVPETEQALPTAIPDTAEKMLTLQDVLDPSRSIDIWAVYDGSTMHDGTEITLVSVFHGYDNLDYSFHWEVNTGGGWQAVGNPNDARYHFQLTETLYHAAWRVVVNITGGETE